MYKIPTDINVADHFFLINETLSNNNRTRKTTLNSEVRNNTRLVSKNPLAILVKSVNFSQRVTLILETKALTKVLEARQSRE